MMEAAAGYCEKISMREREHHHQHYHQSCPSFSSTLLDAIYRSIDEGGGEAGAARISHHQHNHRHLHQQQMFYQEDTISHQQGNAWKGHIPKIGSEYQTAAYMIENRKENKGSGKATSSVVKQNYTAVDLRTSPRGLWNYSSSSSVSSSNKGGFSSSESDFSSLSESKSRSSSSCYSIKKLKPIKTSIMVDRHDKPHIIDSLSKDDKFRVVQVVRPYTVNKQDVVKAKSSKASKIYGEFKRASGNNIKHPISPGSKLASFLNALFNAKKAKISNGYDDNFHGKVFPKSGYSSTCSSASSFSRSCLSKTPTSRGKFNNDGTKRSVKFCPVSVVVDEDSRPYGQKSAMLGDPSLIPKISLKDQDSKTMSSNYEKARNIQVPTDVEDREDDDDNDGASCASSDLFELENLSGVGINGIGGYTYSEELPVYETTNLDTNRAIANGYVV